MFTIFLLGDFLHLIVFVFLFNLVFLHFYVNNLTFMYISAFVHI